MNENGLLREYYANPILGAIEGFKNPSCVYGLIDESSPTFTHSVNPKYVKFFGYEDQCKKNLENYPNTILISELQTKLKTYLREDDYK